MYLFKKFIFSNKNITGLAFASVIIFLALCGILKSFWLPVALIAYVLGVLIAPEEKTLTFLHTKKETFQDYVGFLDRLHSRVNSSSKITIDAKNIIMEIHSTSTELLSFLQEKNSIDPFSEDIMNLKMIFDSYLPNLINEYEKLPMKYANDIKTSSGKTAKDMFIEQLHILSKKTTEIAYGLYENDVTALKVNGLFLKEKFDKKNMLEFEINS